MDNYQKAIQEMISLFGRDHQFCLATFSGDVPSQRFVDTYFDGGSFYVVTYALSQKVKELSANPNVSLCGRRMHSFSGRAYNIGHPLAPENAAIREKLVKVFGSWYFLHNNEQDVNMCYIRIDPLRGFFHRDGFGYSVDFVSRTADIAPFSLNTVFTEEV